MLELELKAVVPDPADLRRRLIDAGAEVTFRGRMRDRRFDRDGELRARDEVLRVRRYEPSDGEPREVIAWKGPTGVTDGYKSRDEIAAALAPGASLRDIIEALGYAEVHAIDRHVELYMLHDGEARLEWYPELDVLVEVEGEPQVIERIVAVTGIERTSFRSEPLDWFASDYRRRTGREARVHLDPGEVPAHWPRA